MRDHANLALSMSDEGRRVTYLCLQQSRQGQGSFAHVRGVETGLRGHGWDVTRIEPRFRGGEGANTARKLSSMARALATFARRVRAADIALIRNHPLSLPAVRWARLHGIPVVQDVNGTTEDFVHVYPWLERYRVVMERGQRRSLRTSHAAIAVSNQLAAWARRHAPRLRIEVVLNGVDPDVFHPAAEPPAQVDLPDRYVLFVGTLAAWADTALLIDAVDDPVWPGDVSVVIAGDGPNRRSVEEAARKNPRITYLGRLPHRAMPGLLAASLAAVNPLVPGEIRGSPIKLFEAMACGVPLIVTDAPAQSRLVRASACGVVVPPRVTGEFARAVERLAADPRKRTELGSAGRDAVLREHTWHARGAEIGSLFEALTAARDPR